MCTTKEVGLKMGTNLFILGLLNKVLTNYKEGKVLINMSIKKVPQIIKISSLTILVHASETQL